MPIETITRVFDAGAVSVTIRRLPYVALPEGRLRPWSVVATRGDGTLCEGVSSDPGPEALPGLLDFIAALLERGTVPLEPRKNATELRAELEEVERELALLRTQLETD